MNGYALDSTTTNLRSHVPCVYWETPLGFLVQLRKTLWSSYLEQYIENNIQGDYYTHALEVYHKFHVLNNPGERQTILNPSYHLRLLVTFSSV